MEELLIDGIDLDSSQGRVTLHGVQDKPGVAAMVFNEISKAINAPVPSPPPSKKYEDILIPVLIRVRRRLAAATTSDFSNAAVLFGFFRLSIKA